MSWELSYETYANRLYSNELDSKIEETEDLKKRIENEILATMLMDPSKLRNQKKSTKKDEDYDDEYSYLNNAQYIVHLWEELKEQWEEAVWTLKACYNAKDAIERGTRQVEICPDCAVELEWQKLQKENTADSNWFVHDVLTCPKCGKKFASSGDIYAAAHGGDKLDKPVPTIATIKTWHEG